MKKKSKIIWSILLSITFILVIITGTLWGVGYSTQWCFLGMSIIFAIELLIFFVYKFKQKNKPEIPLNNKENNISNASGLNRNIEKSNSNETLELSNDIQKH